MEDLSARLAHEGMVHLGRAVRLQWLDIVVLAIEGRRRSCPRCLRSGGRRGALRPLCIFLDDFCGGGLRSSSVGRDGGPGGRDRERARAFYGLDGAMSCLHVAKRKVRRTSSRDSTSTVECGGEGRGMGG